MDKHIEQDYNIVSIAAWIAFIAFLAVSSIMINQVEQKEILINKIEQTKREIEILKKERDSIQCCYDDYVDIHNFASHKKENSEVMTQEDYVFAAGAGISVSGTYPSYTISVR